MRHVYLVGDVHELLAAFPANYFDFIVGSPPFFLQRNYLAELDQDKAKELGAESSPAEYLDGQLHVTEECRRVLAPHGSLCWEIGDTYAGSGGAGGDYAKGGSRAGQAAFVGTATKMRSARSHGQPALPLTKSKTMVDTLYPASLAYGRNLLREPMSAAELLRWIDDLRSRGASADDALCAAAAWVAEHGPAYRFDPWRVRNLIVWAKPNPSVGALGDKFRPATSHITVACKHDRRWFDLDAVRTGDTATCVGGPRERDRQGRGRSGTTAAVPTGGPPLDWHADDHPEDGDWLWKLPTHPYKGAHHATFPLALPSKLIQAMCPRRVCTTCGTPSSRITERTPEYAAVRDAVGDFNDRDRRHGVGGNRAKQLGKITGAQNVTTGWTTCGCAGADGLRHDGFHTGPAWRPGRVLDPFAGSGTTLEAAHLLSRSSVGFDLDRRNVDLARERVGMFLEFPQDAPAFLAEIEGEQ